MDEEKAKENLLDIGYYRLGFYFFPFEVTYPQLKKRDRQTGHLALFRGKPDSGLWELYGGYTLRSQYLCAWLCVI